MKKVMIAVISLLILSGCGKIQYETGMFADVRDYDFCESAVAYCINEGYFLPEGENFGIKEAMLLSECADIFARIDGAKSENSIEYVIKMGIAPFDYPDWDAVAKREDVAYMAEKVAKGEDINPVISGAVMDAGKTYAKEAIYSLYRKGVFSGDKENNLFRPTDYVTKSEMAVIIDRICNEESRARFEMTRLEASFIAFGDTIGHSPVISAGKRGTGYDFTHLFENVKVYIDNADVACVNQETVFVESNFSGYPSFGSPEGIGVAEALAGFDVITHATNHAFDRGVGGVLYTTSFWEKYPEITMLGIHEDKSDAEEISVIEVNGIKIALLNYTYSLNGYRLPSGKEYMVDLLDEEKIISDMEKARKVSDAIVVFAHWGNEYQNKPCQSQKNWAQLFADNGATVIVGAHPHVVQPLETVIAFDGRTVPVYYSLGNFISNQNDYQNALCAMADFKIVKDEAGVRCEEEKIEPVITHMENGYYSAYLLKDYPEEKILRHKHRGKYGQRFSVEAYSQVFESIVK